MAGKPKLSSVGQGRGTEDPQQLMRGTYKDPVESMSIEERLPMRDAPKAPDPDPFRQRSG